MDSSGWGPFALGAIPGPVSWGVTLGVLCPVWDGLWGGTPGCLGVSLNGPLSCASFLLLPRLLYKLFLSECSCVCVCVFV